MKKTFTLFLISVAFSVNAFAQLAVIPFRLPDVNGGIWYMRRSEDTDLIHKVEVIHDMTHSPNTVGYPGNEYYFGDIVIPDEVVYQGITYKVIGIGDGAFQNTKNLNSVTILANIEYIDQDAFSNTSNSYTSQLTSVTFPPTVTSFGNRAFLSCAKLTSITIPEGVTSIGRDCFSGCTKLKFYGSVLPSTLTFLGGHGVFMNCKELEQIVIPEGITSIEDETFSGCSKLTSVTLPSTLTLIGLQSFKDCTALPHITIPGKVNQIKAQAFQGCSGLTSVELAEGITSVYNTFAGCSSLKTVILPSTLKSIGDYAFQNTALKSIIIPDGVTSIGLSAFSFTPLTSVVLPETVTSIGTTAFYGCASLASVDVLATGTPTKLSIGEQAFMSCPSLRNFSLAVRDPDNVLTPECPWVSDCVFEADGYDINATLWVPCGFLSGSTTVVQAYENSEFFWTDFVNGIKPKDPCATVYTKSADIDGTSAVLNGKVDVAPSITGFEYKIYESSNSWTQVQAQGTNLSFSLKLNGLDPHIYVYKAYVVTGGQTIYGSEMLFTITGTTTGFDEYPTSAKRVSLYPNPATTFVNLHVEGADINKMTVMVTDMQGRVLTQLKGKDATAIDIGNYSKGLYLVRIFGENFEQIEKLIVK